MVHAAYREVERGADLAQLDIRARGLGALLELDLLGLGVGVGVGVGVRVGVRVGDEVGVGGGVEAGAKGWS